MRVWLILAFPPHRMWDVTTYPFELRVRFAQASVENEVKLSFVVPSKRVLPRTNLSME